MIKSISFGLMLACLLLVNAQTKPVQKPSSGTKANTKTASKPAAKNTGKPAATASNITFTINGKLENYANHLIVLNLYHYNKVDMLDSVRTNDTGGFVFKRTINENSVVFVQYSSQNAVPLIVENGTSVNLVIHTNTSGLHYDITGKKSEKSLELYRFLKEFSRLKGELDNLGAQLNNQTDPVKFYQIQEIGTMKQGEMDVLMDSMLRHKDPLSSYFVLFNLNEEQTPNHYKDIFTRMEPKMVKSTYYTDLKSLYDKYKGIEIGDIAPDIDLPQPDGSTLKLSSLRGKVVLIDFWASWCGPCRAEFPNVKVAYDKYKAKGFEIYGVSLDDNNVKWTTAIKSMGLNWRHVSDLKGWGCAPAKVYKVSGIPATFLIDKDGRVIAKNLRGPALEAKLKELFP